MPIAHWCSNPPPCTIRNGVFSFLMCVLQAKSVGSVRLASRDPHARPTVNLGFLSDPEDFFKFCRGTTLSPFGGQGPPPGVQNEGLSGL
ncbi:hypothetical protein DFH08DRAFT_834418 [Mycena albidolilacea]|uniref:Secreted protein n=1 Tax=Mycena albidolilacea TaxID=1033008 RepID=A0AAD7F5B5_9AGAR|nr:hypothetical protein DFH08DRAFT_834418 [Mycena albidolilacea]